MAKSKDSEKRHPLLDPYKTREFYRCTLEPVDKVLHFGGQVGPSTTPVSETGWLSYTRYFEALSNRPLGCMSYIGLKDNILGYIEDIEKKLKVLENGRDVFQSLQVGLALTWDGRPTSRYEDEVAKGRLDGPIHALLKGYQQSQRPIYLRIGFECNGESWNGYRADSYIKAFNHVAKKVKEVNEESRQTEGMYPNIATVWNLSMAVDPGIGRHLHRDMRFRPDDDLTDWWSINVFEKQNFKQDFLYDYLDLAHKAGKPVMLGEATPQFMGTSRGEADWNEWFVPYFNLIRSYPGIKATSYINWDWYEMAMEFGQPWGHWGDARVDNKDLLRKWYDQEKSSSFWLNACDKNTLVKALTHVE